VTHLIFDLGQLLFFDDEVQGEQGDDEAVTSITEHDGEQERERGDGEQSWIDLAVVGHSVSVDQHLETLGELVGAVERRPCLSRLHRRQNRLEGADLRVLFIMKSVGLKLLRICQRFESWLLIFCLVRSFAYSSG